MGLFSSHNQPKMNPDRWYFPYGQDLQMESGSNASLEMFRDQPLDSLAREICQNSLDAAAGQEPVKVAFQYFDLPTEQLPNVKQLRDDILPAAQKEWTQEKKTQQMLKRMAETLSQPTIPVLKISDYQTTGLLNKNWQSLIEQAGSSIKKDDSSAGSFGIGKGAPFAVSDLRMVGYNSLAADGHRSICVMKFVSYKLREAKQNITQGTGYFGACGKQPFDTDLPFDQKHPRQETGTDIYVLGFNRSLLSDWQTQIKRSIVDNFLFSLYKNRLVVEVDGETIDYPAAKMILDDLQQDKRLAKKYRDAFCYLNVLEDPDHCEFSLQGLTDYGVPDGDAVLLTSNCSQANNRRVLMTREVGMKIYEQNRISSTLQFSGIFWANGEKINQLLKELENPNHDKWSEKRAADPKKMGEFLRSIRRFISTTIKNQYEQKIEEQVDAFGVSSFLPDDLNAFKGAKAQLKQKGSNRPKVKLEAQPQTSDQSPVRASETEFSDDLDEFGVTGVQDGETSGSGYDGGEGGGIDGSNDTAFGNRPGSHAPDKGNDQYAKINVKRQLIGNVTYRCIEADYHQGRYNLLINPGQPLDQVRIGINVVGDSGNKDIVRVKAAALADGTPLGTSFNSVYLDQLAKGQWHRIEMILNRNSRLKLEVEVYAHCE